MCTLITSCSCPTTSLTTTFTTTLQPLSLKANRTRTGNGAPQNIDQSAFLTTNKKVTIQTLSEQFLFNIMTTPQDAMISLNNLGAELMLDVDRQRAIKVLGDALQLCRNSFRCEEESRGSFHNPMNPSAALTSESNSLVPHSDNFRIYPIDGATSKKKSMLMDIDGLEELGCAPEACYNTVRVAEGTTNHPDSSPFHLFIFQQPLRFELVHQAPSCHDLDQQQEEPSSQRTQQPLGPEIKTVLSSVIIFNLALGSHLMALEEIHQEQGSRVKSLSCPPHGSGMSSSCINERARMQLEKAARLYFCAIDLQENDEKINIEPRMLLLFASINNLAQIYSILGQKDESHACFRHLLSLLLLLVDSGACYTKIEGFWANVFRFVFPPSLAVQPAAAA